jgi:hypothetical protein
MELAVAIAIDPLSLTRSGPPPSPVPPGGAAPGGQLPPAVPTGGTAPAAAKPAASTKTITSRLVLGAQLSLGAQPGVGGGASLTFELQWKHLVLGVEGDVLFPATGPLGPGEIQTSLVGGKLLPCYDFGILDGCGVLWLAAERAQILPADPNKPPHITNLLISLGGRALHDIAFAERFFVRGQFDILVPVAYTPLVAGNGAFTWNRPPLSLTLGLGLGWRLP